MNIRHPPLLDYLSASQSVDMKLFDGYIASGWRDTRKLTPLCSCGPDPYGYPIALGYDVLNLLMPVGKRSSMAHYRTLDALDSPPLSSTDEVTDKFGRIQIICRSKVAFTPKFSFRTKDYGFVLRQCL